MMYAIPYPNIDPVAVSLGPFDIRWYALAYLVGLLLGWAYAARLAARQPQPFDPRLFDDFVTWAVLGVVLGGRLGYVLFYKPLWFLEHPEAILQMWKGGMAFHGGLLGVALVTILFARRHQLPVLALGDLAAAAAPIGLFFGRVANFINGELYGRVSDVPWAMVFPTGGPLPRHPSQLYEAMLEGLVLLVLLWWAQRQPSIRQRYGTTFGIFLIGYGIARSIVEFFRQPDAHLGFLMGGSTMGQLLSLPMILVGIALILAVRRPRS